VRILNISLGQDTGGQQMRLRRAFQRHMPTWEYEAVTSTHTFYEIQRKYNPAVVNHDLWPRAHVVHTHNNLANIARFERRGVLRKPYVIHHHGTMYRIGYRQHLRDAKERRAVPIVSTLDLQAIAPDVTTWVPQAYSLDELASYRGAKRDDGVLRIAHAPTNRAIKSTEVLIAAVDRLRKEGAAVELDVIERVSNVECMRRKGTADVYVDQVLFGYGCNAVEAWGMGLPVIAGVDPELCLPRTRMRIPADTRDLMLSTWGTLPFYEATEGTLYDALVAMLKPATRRKYAKLGMDHVKRWHDERLVVEQLKAIYAEAIARKR
jgi:hypothetical protein